MKIVWTGSAGFIAGYAIEELLQHGHEVIGVDNYSKYGKVKKSYDNHKKYTFIEGDAKDINLMKRVSNDADIIVSGAAMIGGISYFHRLAYDLLAENERITAAAFDTAIWAYQKKSLKKIVLISSSMVYGSAARFPTPESTVDMIPPPNSTYGFQKLASEYYARGAWEEYGLPYTVIRPFNCVGTGEIRARRSKEIVSGNVKLAMGHVVPDLIQKILKNQEPLHILGNGEQVRHYTYGADMAVGIRLCIEKKEALNNAFNISTSESTSVLELAEQIWKKIKHNQPFKYVLDEPFAHDIQKRIPDISKAKKVLGFEATTTLDDMLDIVIPWVKAQLELGNL